MRRMPWPLGGYRLVRDSAKLMGIHSAYVPCTISLKNALHESEWEGPNGLVLGEA